MKWHVRLVLFITMLLSGNVDLRSQNLFDDLVLYYSMDDGAAFDGSPNQLNGLVSGATATSDRNASNNSALNFDPGNVVQIPFDENLEIQFPVSFAAWLYFDTEDFRDWAVFRTDFQKNNYSGFYVARFGNGRIGLVGGGNQGIAGSSNARGINTVDPIPSQQWVHVVITMADHLTGEVYINGCPVASATTGSGPSTVGYSQSPGFIGRNDNDGSLSLPLEPDRFLDGKVDELYFWNRVVSLEEVQILYDRYHVPEFAFDDVESCGERLVTVANDSIQNIIWSTGEIGDTILIDSSDTYSVVAKYECFDLTDTFEAVVNELTLDLMLLPSGCSEPVTIEASGIYQLISWNTGETTPSIDVSASGIYIATATSPLCGSISDTVLVNIQNLPNLSLEDTYTICSGDTLNLSVDQAFDQVLWSTGETDSSISITNGGQYIVSAIVEGCDTLTKDFVVTIIEPQESEVGVLWCPGETLTINDVDYNKPGLYQQVLVSANGCDSLLSITIQEDACAICPDRFSSLKNLLLIQKLDNSKYNVLFTDNNQTKEAEMGYDSLIIFLKEHKLLDEYIHARDIQRLLVGGQLSLKYY